MCQISNEISTGNFFKNWSLSKVLESALIDLIQDSADLNIRDRYLQLIKSIIKTSCDWYNLGKLRGVAGCGDSLFDVMCGCAYLHDLPILFYRTFADFHILSLTIIRYMQLTHFVSATFLKAQKDILFFFYYMDTFEIMIPFFIVSPYTHLCTYHTTHTNIYNISIFHWAQYVPQ